MPMAIAVGGKPGRPKPEPERTQTGSTGTPAPIASIDAPARALPISPDFWRVPSTKTPSTSPLASTARAARSAARSGWPRSIGNAPVCGMTVPTTGTDQSSRFAM